MALKFRVVQTCTAYPEQYDVYLGANKERVGYLRLRGGMFRCDYKSGDSSFNGVTIYSKRFFDDPIKGSFLDEQERDTYLKEALQVLSKVLNLYKVPDYYIENDRRAT